MKGQKEEGFGPGLGGWLFWQEASLALGCYGLEVGVLGESQWQGLCPPTSAPPLGVIQDVCYL
jgi:hypothetical protein